MCTAMTPQEVVAFMRDLQEQLAARRLQSNGMAEILGALLIGISLTLLMEDWIRHSSWRRL